MISITIDNSICKVSGTTAQELSDLRNLLLYVERTGRWIRTKDKQGKLISRPEILRHFLMDRKGAFPTGLLYVVLNHFDKKGIPYTKQDVRVIPTKDVHGAWAKIKPKRNYAPYPEQIEASLWAQKEGRGIIVAPTGTGKSAIAAEIIDRLRVPTLIVVPSLELKRQLTEGLREFFGFEVVGPLREGKVNCLVTVENVDALDTKSKLAGIDLVIIDEFHHSGAKTYRVLNNKAWAGVYYKIGLTATPFRSRDEERLLLESVLSKVIYKIDYQTAVGRGYIVPMEVFYIDLPKIKVKCSGTNFHSVYKELIVERSDRNQIIADLTEKLHKAEKSTLILTKQVLHGELIESMLLERGLVVPFVKGENEDNREVIGTFNRAEESVLIGTTGIIGEGVDTKPCEYVILAGGGKSKNAFMQQLGRGFRRYGDKESCKIIMFREPSHKWFLEHHNACCDYLLEEYGITPTKLDI